MCPDCHHTLAAKDLVPVLSWLWLRGRCRYCHKPISWQYPAVELLTGLLFALSYVSWPHLFHGVGLFQFVVWLICVVFFVALAVYDLHWFLLPDRLVFPLTVLVGLQVLVSAVWLHSFAALWQPVVGAGLIFGLFWVLYQISKGQWIGGGDVKLAVALGLLAATPFRAFMVIFFASLLGTVVSIPLLARGKQGLKLHIPFGPYLLAATYIVVLYGAHISTWYQTFLLGQ
jgi:prepilin signal peptidase PulO-like enzyme (type II secretory pathway)